MDRYARVLSDLKNFPERNAAIVVLSHGRFTPEGGPNGARTPKQVRIVEETKECQARVRFAFDRMVQWRLWHDPEFNQSLMQPVIALSGATQQLKTMIDWIIIRSMKKERRHRALLRSTIDCEPFPYANSATQFQAIRRWFDREAHFGHLFGTVELLTSDYHVPRCELYLAKYLPLAERQGTEIRVIGMPWASDPKRMKPEAAESLKQGEIRRCLQYAQKGDCAWPWD